MGGHRDRGLGEMLAGDATEEERAADRRRAAAGTFGGHLPTTFAEARRDAGDLLTGLLHGSGIDTAGAHAAQVADSGSWTGPVFDRLLGEADQEAQHAAERSPIAAGSGGGVGEVAPFAVAVPAAPEATAAEAVAEGAPLLSRLAAGAGRIARGAIRPAGETAAYSAATSRAPTPEGAALDTIAGGVGGGLVGSASAALGEGFSALTSAEARRLAHRAADRQRVASVRGESRGTISHRDFDSLIEGLGRGGRTRDERTARAAQAIRESGIVGPMSSVGEIADRATRAESRAIERMDAIRAEADAAGASVPADAVPSALDRYAADLDPMSLGRWADAPREEARVWRDAVTPGQHGAEMRPHPAFGPDHTLDDLLAERALLPPMPGGGPETLSGMSHGSAASREGEQEAFWRDLRDEDMRSAPADDTGVVEEPGGGPYRSVDPRRSAAARDAHVHRVEADEMVEHDLDEALVPAWRAIGARRRAEFQRTPRSSRAEAFTEWAHNHGADVQRMQIDAQEAGIGGMQEPPPADVTLSRDERHALPDSEPAADEGLAGYGPDVEGALQSIDEQQGGDREALLRAIQEAAGRPAGPARGLTIPRQRAEDALRILDRTTQWVTPSGQTLAPDTQVARQMRHVVRDTIDESLAPFLTPERMAEYPAARREYSRARTIGDVVRPAEERAAGRSSLASAAQAAGPIIASGGGAAPAVAAGIGYRALRGRGATMDATLLEALSSALSAAPGAAERIAPLLERARRGGTLSAASHLLADDAPEPTEAERAIGASASPEAAPPDRAALRRAARRELARRELARRAATRDTVLQETAP